MSSLATSLKRLLRSSRGSRAHASGFTDTLLQSFENCRTGLPDEAIASGREAVAAFFLSIYEREVPRLREELRLTASGSSFESLWRVVDGLARTVVIPAYSRYAAAYTPRERNDFFMKGHLHGLERLLWGVGGLALGGFAIWAPFVPIWSKEWVLPFMVGGLLFPELRRWYSVRRYESRLNDLAQRAEAEIARLDRAYLLGPQEVPARAETRPEDVDARAAPEPVRLKESS